MESVTTGFEPSESFFILDFVRQLQNHQIIGLSHGVWNNHDGRIFGDFFGRENAHVGTLMIVVLCGRLSSLACGVGQSSTNAFVLVLLEWSGKGSGGWNAFRFAFVSRLWHVE